MSTQASDFLTKVLRRVRHYRIKEVALSDLHGKLYYHSRKIEIDTAGDTFTKLYTFLHEAIHSFKKDWSEQRVKRETDWLWIHLTIDELHQLVEAYLAIRRIKDKKRR